MLGSPASFHHPLGSLSSRVQSRSTAARRCLDRWDGADKSGSVDSLGSEWVMVEPVAIQRRERTERTAAVNWVNLRTPDAVGLNRQQFVATHNVGLVVVRRLLAASLGSDEDGLQEAWARSADSRQ